MRGSGGRRVEHDSVAMSLKFIIHSHVVSTHRYFMKVSLAAVAGAGRWVNPHCETIGIGHRVPILWYQAVGI